MIGDQKNDVFYKILIVEDCISMQHRLLKILEGFNVNHENIKFSKSLKDAYNELKNYHPTLILVDLGLPDGYGQDLIKWVNTYLPNTLSMVISAWSNSDMVLSAIKAGAVGYMLKERDDVELLLALNTLALGGSPIDPFVAGKILFELRDNKIENLISTQDNCEKLSSKEIHILNQVAIGLTNKEISRKLSLSRHTIDTHIRNIYRKLSVRSRINAVKLAKEIGII